MPLIASLSLAIALTALLFSTRKDAHHVRLELSRLSAYSLVLGMNNDSAVAFGILSVGYFQSAKKIVWIERVGNHVTNKFVQYPIRVEARSLLALELAPWRNNIHSEKFGICVQLETGRIYILKNTLTLRESIKLQIAASVSRLTRGKYAPGMPSRPRLPFNPVDS
jgi:hypothetical protein